jgi:hypothetical protein
MAADEEILKRLDLIQATLALAFAPQLEDARTRIRGDELSAEILDMTEDWIGTTRLQEQVAEKLSKTTRSVRNRLPELVEKRVLQTRGTGSQLEYRRTGLI